MQKGQLHTSSHTLAKISPTKNPVRRGFGQFAPL